MFLILAMGAMDATITQTKQEYFMEYNIATTCCNEQYYVPSNTFNFSTGKKYDILSTNLQVKALNTDDTTTWRDVEMSNFDIISKFNYNKSFKVKSKITRVSTYIPNIVLD